MRFTSSRLVMPAAAFSHSGPAQVPVPFCGGLGGDFKRIAIAHDYSRPYQR